MKFIIIIALIFSVSISAKAGSINHIKANPKSGFYSDYFYEISQNTTKNDKINIVIIPNNTPGTIIPEDDGGYQSLWNGYAKTWGIGSKISRLLLENLKIVILAPAFPTQNNSGIYSNQLNKKSMETDRSEWLRHDLQLIQIIKNMKIRLKKQGFNVDERVSFIGFSSQSDFATRFAILHPEIVKIVAVGGIVDYLTLPISEYQNQQLPYPLGVNDVKKFEKTNFNLETLKNVKFFLFDGEDDKNTTFNKQYGVWSENDIDLIFKLFADNKYDENNLYNPKILHQCLEIWRENGINFEYKKYPNTKHNFTYEMKTDVLDFFKNNL